MELRMAGVEQALFKNVVSCARSYLEFGAGGSTVFAATAVKGPVYSIESDNAWIDTVRSSIEPSEFERKLLFVDIGPTGAWGKPKKPHGPFNYLNYHDNVWKDVEGDFDVYFIDGRFRVACFTQCVIRSPDDAIIGMHDYTSRPAYHVVEQIAVPIARSGDLSFFKKKRGVSPSVASSLLAQYALDPT